MHEDSKALDVGVDSEYAVLAAEVFALLADVTRVQIVLALGDRELSVSDLADRIHKSATSVSQHLAKLRWARVVTTRQDGTRVYYRLIDEHVRLLVQQAVFQAEHAIDANPSHHARGGGKPSPRRSRP